MRRRAFISVLGRSLATTLVFCPEWGVSQEMGSRYLVETPEKRAQYLARVLKMLCTDIGPRPAGSEDYIRGAEIIKKEMELALPAVELDWFQLRGWRLLDEPLFYCGDQRLEIYPHTGSEGTPEDGIRGILKKSEGGGFPFVIVEPGSGKNVAQISFNSYGRANTATTESAAVPTVCIGKQDVPLLEKAVENSTQVRLRFKVEFIPDARSCSVVGTLPGETDEEIIFLAHADTQYTTPGANDNTASVVALLMLAHAVSGTKGKRAITFVATGAEERSSVGAKHYAAKREAAGTLKNIKFCVNFDALTFGPNLYLHSRDDGLKQLVTSIRDDLKPHNVHDVSYPIALEYFPKERMQDDGPFAEAGVRTLDINSRGYDEKTLPVFHRPEDTAEAVPVDCVENSFLIFAEYIKRIQLL